MLLIVLLACEPGSIRLTGKDTGLDTATVACLDEHNSLLDCDEDGYTPDDGDCNDADATANPAVPEDCDDSVDNNCDGAADAADADCEGVVDTADDTASSDTDSDSDTDVDEDADSDGYTTTEGDCNDADDAVYPQNHELGIGEELKCSDAIDNDCDGTIDSTDADCGDSDSDDIVDGVDALYAIDQDHDGLKDTLCEVADLTMADSYASEDGIRQGNPSDTWGGFDRVSTDSDQVDEIGAVEAGTRCFNFGSSGLETTRYRYRYVAESTQSEDCSDWIVSDLEVYCDLYRDEYCVEYGTGVNPCDYNWVIAVELLSDGSIRGN